MIMTLIGPAVEVPRRPPGIQIYLTAPWEIVAGQARDRGMLPPLLKTRSWCVGV